MITFTRYPNAYSVDGDVISQPWADWLDVLTEHDHRESKDGPAIVLGLVEGKRKAANVVALHAIGADLDDMTDEQIGAALTAAEPYRHVAWTTHSHGAEGKGSRWRLLFPFDEPAEPTDAKRLHLGLDALLGGNVVDPKTKDAGRLFYLPSVPAPLEDLATAFESDDDAPPIAPAALLALAPVRAALVVTRPEGLSPDLERVRQYVLRLSTSHPSKAAASALARGEPFAAAGHRHNAVLALTSLLAQKRANLSDDDLQSLFGASLAAMTERDGDDDTLEIDEVITAYVGAVEKLSEWREAQSEERTAQAQEAQAGDAGPYEAADLVAIADGAGCAVGELAERWILQREGRAYLLDHAGGYRGPYTKDDAPLAAIRVLRRAPVRLVEMTETGPRRRSWPDVVADHGTALDSEVASFTASRTHYRADVFELQHAPCPVRDLEPFHDPEIATWLALVASDKIDRLLDWLSVCPDLSRLLCALYLEGAPGSGKTLLAVGLARLWTEESPTPMQELVGNYSEHLLRCPLVLADEEIRTPFGSATVTAQIRSIISQHTHTVTRKFLKPIEAHGAVRMILAANHDQLLKSADVTTDDDLRAIAERFLHLRVDDDAAAYLQTLAPGTSARWAREGIARHALALAASRSVPETGNRFAVAGVVDDMHRVLAFSSRFNAQVCEWLTGYVNSPTAYDKRNDRLVFIEKGALFVSTSAIVTGWALYMQHVKDIPDTSTIASALRSFALDGGKTYRRKVGSHVRSFRRINSDTLIAWAKRNGVGDTEAMRAALKTDTPAPEGGQVVRLHR